MSPNLTLNNAHEHPHSELKFRDPSALDYARKCLRESPLLIKQGPDLLEGKLNTAVPHLLCRGG